MNLRTLFYPLMVTLSLSGSAAAAEIKVLSSNSMTSVLNEVAPLFERSTGHKVTLGFGTSAQVAKRVQEGEPADVVVITPQAIDRLVQQGKVAAGSGVQVVRSLMGIGVRAGAPRPDIGTAEALKRALLAAKSVTFSDPATGAESGLHAMRIFERLDIAAEMKPKSKFGDGTSSGQLVVSGEAELAIWQVSAMKPVAGLEIIGLLPTELQHTTFISAGVGASTKASDAASAFIKFLGTPEAAAVIKAKGLEPG
jgi:molybdate transport system substrate-binding protein